MMRFIHSVWHIVLFSLLLSACHSSSEQAQLPQAASPAAVAVSSVQASQPDDVQSIASEQHLLGVDVRKDKIGGDFTLIDGSGRAFSLNSLRGKVVVLAFGFTNCPDVCPMELLTYQEVMKKLGVQSQDVAVVFVSVDPERDTPSVIGQYVQRFHPQFIGLTDTRGGADVEMVKKLYRIVSAKTEVKSAALYNIDHTSGTYLIDKKGRTAMFEPYGVESAQMAADVQKLLAE